MILFLTLPSDGEIEAYRLNYSAAPTEALKYVDKALELDRNNANTWNTKGAALQDLGRYDEAVKAYMKAVALEPECAIAKGNIEFLHNLLR